MICTGDIIIEKIYLIGRSFVQFGVLLLLLTRRKVIHDQRYTFQHLVIVCTISGLHSSASGYRLFNISAALFSIWLSFVQYQRYTLQHLVIVYTISVLHCSVLVEWIYNISVTLFSISLMDIQFQRYTLQHKSNGYTISALHSSALV